MKRAYRIALVLLVVLVLSAPSAFAAGLKSYYKPPTVPVAAATCLRDVPAGHHWYQIMSQKVNVPYYNASLAIAVAMEVAVSQFLFNFNGPLQLGADAETDLFQLGNTTVEVMVVLDPKTRYWRHYGKKYVVLDGWHFKPALPGAVTYEKQDGLGILALGNDIADQLVEDAEGVAVAGFTTDEVEGGTAASFTYESDDLLNAFHRDMRQALTARCFNFVQPRVKKGYHTVAVFARLKAKDHHGMPFVSDEEEFEADFIGHPAKVSAQLGVGSLMILPVNLGGGFH
jgi:hypothetical protein